MADSSCEPPESQCRRYDYLEKCIENFVRSHQDKPGSCRRLRKALPAVYQRYPEALLHISNSFGEKYIEDTMKSVESLLENSKLREKLVKLQMLPENETLWRPSGDPDKDIRAHTALVSQTELQDLEQQIMEEEEKLKELEAKVSEKDEGIKRKILHLTTVAEELTCASRVALSNQENLNNLIRAAIADV